MRKSTIDFGASSSRRGHSDSEQTHSNDTPSGNWRLGSQDIDAISDACGKKVELLILQEDPNYG